MIGSRAQGSEVWSITAGDCLAPTQKAKKQLGSGATLNAKWVLKSHPGGLWPYESLEASEPHPSHFWIALHLPNENMRFHIFQLAPLVWVPARV